MNDNNQEQYDREQRDPTVRPSVRDTEGHTSWEDEVRDGLDLARHGDPSRVKTATERTGGRSHVVWVRPSELMAQAGGRVAGRGIDFQAELARRARHLPARTGATSRRAISERAHRLPPITAFGRDAQVHVGAAPSGIGLN